MGGGDEGGRGCPDEESVCECAVGAGGGGGGCVALERVKVSVAVRGVVRGAEGGGEGREEGAAGGGVGEGDGRVGGGVGGGRGEEVRAWGVSGSESGGFWKRGWLTDGSSVVNKWAVDNLVTHVCALALVIDDFEVDTQHLKEDLRLENKEYVIISCTTYLLFGDEHCARG